MPLPTTTGTAKSCMLKELHFTGCKFAWLTLAGLLTDSVAGALEPMLTVMRADDCGLRGGLPPGLGRLSRLEVLSMRGEPGTCWGG